MVAQALLSSKNQEYETPPAFFQRLNENFRFTLDACANIENAKCERFFAPEDDGLSKPWTKERVWLNPPYHNRKPGQADWVRKALYETTENGCDLVCCLLPSRTDTKLFHDLVIGRAESVLFVRGRLTFVGAPASAVFPSMVVFYRNEPLSLENKRAGIYPTRFGTINAK